MTALPAIDELTVSIIAIDRPVYLQQAVASLFPTTPAGATLQITLNACGADTRGVADAALARWRGPTRRLTLERRLNFAQAHNFALREVQTEFVNFMGDDDVNLEPKLLRQLRLFENEDVLAVGTFARRVGGRPGGPLRSKGYMDVGPTSVEEMRRQLECDQPIHLVFPSVVVRTKAIRDVGGFREVFGPAADVDLWTRLAERGTVLAIPERLFGFRVHDESGSSRQFFEARHLVRYAQSCLAARQRGLVEPTLAEYERSRGGLPTRVRRRLEDVSRYNFRKAGAAWLEQRYLSSLTRVAVSFVASPVECLRKVAEQSGIQFRSGADRG
ncbi:MAG: hypothetical protein C3F08_00435 [Candidatus Methylomirabilota bacterium]|nr:MAG: hypothetical protein C3F08_00435 [candidate division NC10 bacterium]